MSGNFNFAKFLCVPTRQVNFRPFKEIFNNARVNNVRRAMVCDVYFSFSKILELYQRDCTHIHNIF